MPTTIQSETSNLRQSKIDKMCGSKKPYFSQISVHCAMGRVAAYFPERKNLRAYNCPICGNWHITTQPRQQQDIWVQR